jgi:hypothetical protein
MHFIMQATTKKVCDRARGYAVLLDGLIHDKASPGAVAARIKAMAAQRPTAPDAVGKKRADPPSHRGSASSTAPKTQGPRAPKRARWLPEGINDQSSFQALHEAIRDLKRRMKEDLPQDELWTLMEQCEHVQDLIVHRKDRFKRQQRIRRENKAAARLKRMGGRVRP